MVQAIDHEWIRKLSKERWMVRAMKGAIDGTSDRSRSSRRRYRSGAVEEAMEGAIVGTSDGSRSI